MVHTRHPQGIEALSPLEAGEHIVQREDQRMAHVQIASDIGRRDHDGPGPFLTLGLGLEDLGGFPFFVPPGLGGSEIKGLIHIAHAESWKKESRSLRARKCPNPIHQSTGRTELVPWWVEEREKQGGAGAGGPRRFGGDQCFFLASPVSNHHSPVPVPK
ncbi:MAG: hypothetical protein IPN59_14970 [Holophaga sp.]|nr:hypothetical protein [Holophaga sp.]